MPKAKKTRAQLKEEIFEGLVEGRAYMSPEGIVDCEMLLKFMRQSPGVFDLLVLSATIHGDVDLHDDTDSLYHILTEDLVSGLASVVMDAAEGNDRAAIQLKAIEKLLKPEKFELPQNKIQELVDRYETSPPLARGWELRRLMSALWSVVEPIHSDRGNLINQPVRLMDSPDLPFYAHLWALAKKHCKTNTTLQSLAFRIYAERLQAQGISDEGATITDRTLKRDLESVRKWEQNASEEEKRRRGLYKGSSDRPMIWFGFSDGWKSRTRNRKSRKKNVTKRRAKDSAN